MATYGARHCHFRYPMPRIETSSPSIHSIFPQPRPTAGSARFTQFVRLGWEKGQVARKFRIPSRRDPRSTRGRSDLSELCVIGQRIRRQHARFRIARQFHAKNSARQRRGHCINIRDVSPILRRVRWP